MNQQLEVPQPIPYSHVPLTGKQTEPKDVAEMLKRRPRMKNIIAALVAARDGDIHDLDGGNQWASADIRFLRIHWCLDFVGQRLDGANRLRINDEGRETLALALASQ